MRAGILVREAVRADFPAIVEVWKAQGIAWPERAASAAALEEADSWRAPGRLCLRFLAEVEGRAAGFLSCIETDTYNGRRAFSVNVAVLPALRRQGLGTALFRRLEAELPAHAVPAASAAAAAPRVADAPVRGILCADGYTICPGVMRFLEAFGFRETWRETPVLLDVAGCDTSALPAPCSSSRWSTRNAQAVPRSDHAPPPRTGPCSGSTKGSVTGGSTSGPSTSGRSSRPSTQGSRH